MSEANPPAILHKRSLKWVNICIVAIFVLGTGLRLLDLTDPPLDYFPQRQLRGAIINYSIPMIPAISLSLVPLASVVFGWVRDQDHLARWVVAAVILFSMFYSGWMGRSVLLGKNYRSEAIAWHNMGQYLHNHGDLMGITHEQGYPPAYYGWHHVNPWPYTASDEAPLPLVPDPMGKFTARFEQAVKGQSYFIVTLFGAFDAQPILKSYLYDHYPIYQKGDGFLIFDLTQPITSPP